MTPDEQRTLAAAAALRARYADVLALVHTAEGRRLAEDAAMLAAADALVARSDPGAPAELQAVAVVAALAIPTVTITAIQRFAGRRILPACAPADGDAAWSLRRLAGQLRPDDPAPVVVRHAGWAYRVTGNPIDLEYWLQLHGYPEARCASPSSVDVTREVVRA